MPILCFQTPEEKRRSRESEAAEDQLNRSPPQKSKQTVSFPRSEDEKSARSSMDPWNSQLSTSLHLTGTPRKGLKTRMSSVFSLREDNHNAEPSARSKKLTPLSSSTWGTEGHLTTKEAEILDKMREMCKGHGSDSEMLRFLRARQFNLAKSSALYNNFLKWYPENEPWKQDLNFIRKMFDTGEQYLIGHDRAGRPSVIFKCGLHNKRDGDCSIAAIKFCIETMISRMPEGCETYNIVMDMEGFGWHNMDMPWVMQIAPIIGDCYPERVGAIIVINATWVARKAWDLVKRLVDKRTRSKFFWLSTNKETRNQQLGEFFERDQLPYELGGTCEFSMTEYCDYLSTELKTFYKTSMQNLSFDDFNTLVSQGPELAKHIDKVNAERTTPRLSSGQTPKISWQAVDSPPKSSGFCGCGKHPTQPK